MDRCVDFDVSLSCCQHVQAGKNEVDGIVDYRGDPTHDPAGDVGVEKYKEQEE